MDQSATNPVSTTIQQPTTTTPIRENQVVAAINFLQNVKVQSSPISSRLSFLESKGLTNNEIIEALKRINNNSQEYKLLVQKVNENASIKASDAVKELDNNNINTATTTSTTMPNSNTVFSTTSSQPTTTYTTQQQQPVHTQQPTIYYAHTSPTGQVYYSTTPVQPQQQQSNNNSWFATLATVGSIAGVGAAATYAWQKYMPNIKFEPKHQQMINDTNNTSLSMEQQQQQILKDQQLKSLIDNKSNNNNDNKYNLNYLSDPQNDILETYKSVQSLKSEFKECIELLREQTTDIKRALNTIQLSLEVVTRRTRKNDANQSELNDLLLSIKQLLQKQISGNSDTNGTSSSTKHDKKLDNTLSNLDRIASSWLTNDNTVDNYPPINNRSSDSISNIDKSSDISNNNDDQDKQQQPDTTTDNEHIEHGNRLLNEALDSIKSNNTQDDIRMCIQAMLLYIGNILDNRDAIKYRKILLTNTPYNNRVRRMKSAEQYLLAAGFEINGNYIEWINNDNKVEWKWALLQDAFNKLNHCMFVI